MISDLVDNAQDVVFYNDEDVWLNTKALAELFKIDRSGIINHINDIYNDDELSKDSTYAKSCTRTCI